MEEKEYKVDKGSESTFFSADGGNYFGVAFDKIFKQKTLGVYNLFEMSSKRNFKNLTGSILKTYEELFLDAKGKFDEEKAIILFDLLNAKSKLMVAESTAYDAFIKMVDDITTKHGGLLLRTIGDFVETNYALELDKITEEAREARKKVNEELQFSDSHARNLLKVAYLFRVMIPIISVYFTYNKSLFAKNEEEAQSEDFEDMQFDEINASIFGHLFERVMEPSGKSKAEDKKKAANALRNKLYKLTYSRVSKTSYSDKRFWATAKNHGITKDTVTLDIYKKLLINAIPKLSIEGDRNIVSFFSSVVNNQIDFLFQNKFKYKYTSLGDTSEKYSDEDDEDSEYERLEIQMLRKDEGMYALRKLSIEKVMKSIPEYFGVEVSDAEVKAEVAFANRHSIQEKIVAMMTFKYFKDKSAVKFLSFYQYTFLVLACRKYLEKHKFTLLPQILTASCEKHKERTNISGKRIRPMIQDSKKYKELFASKYRNFSEDVEKPLSSIIGTTYSSVFTGKDGKELFDSTIKVGKVADELLDLAYLI